MVTLKTDVGSQKTLPKSAIKYKVFARVADILNNLDQLSYHGYSLHIKSFLFTIEEHKTNKDKLSQTRIR